jgi:molybdopterin/thiamine biosynthesis adenylyltransferase
MPRHSAEVYALHKVQAARVLVVGCGAVGANAFLALVLSGFRRIALMDFDALEESNCSRAAGLFRPEDAGKKKAGILKAWAEGFMPGIPVKDYPMDVTDVGALFAGRFDAVICAVDNARAVLHIARITAEAGVPVLRGATNGFNASVEVVRNQNGACLGCFKKDGALSEGCGVRYQKAILANQAPTCQVSSALAANRIVRELILFLTEGTAERRVYESAKGALYTAALRRDLNCPNHEEGSSPDSTSLPGTCEGTTLAQLMRITGGQALILEDPLVTEVVCGCGKHRKIMKPLRHLSENDVHGCECAAALIPPARCVTQSLLGLSSEPALLGAPLAALGVRRCALLPVMSAAGEVRHFHFEDDMR